MTKIFWPLAVALVACRFYHFRPYLDHPHLFRQAETAFYSLGFYRHGMNILTPSVGWMGAYRHVVLEFPLTEWIAACLYFIAGPTILVDRVVNLAFFLGSASFLYRIVGLVHDRLLGRIVTLLYMAAPLGIYYSRAVHIDFTAVCLSHALLFYTMRFAAARHRCDLAIAIAAGTLAFVIKAPYAFYLILPALSFAREHDRRLMSLAPIVAAFAIPTCAFLAWFEYSQRVNRQGPDLSFIPSSFTHVDRFEWYFGTAASRWTIEPWRTVVGRVYREIVTTVWWVVVPAGWLARKALARYYRFALWWCGGSLIYLVTFLNLGEMHSYYQIPFIAPFSLLLAAPVYHWWTLTGAHARLGRLAAMCVLIGYVASSVAVASQRFYRTDPLNLAAGEFINRNTADADLIVMAYTKAEYADPSFLFYARRYGWSVPPDELSPAILDGLAPLGATVVVTSSLWPVGEAARSYLGTRPQVAALDVDGGTITIHRLAPTGTRP